MTLGDTLEMKVSSGLRIAPAPLALGVAGAVMLPGGRGAAGRGERVLKGCLWICPPALTPAGEILAAAGEHRRQRLVPRPGQAR